MFATAETRLRERLVRTLKRHTAGPGDVLSVCMMLLHLRSDIAIRERLRLANTIVAEFMDGRRRPIPPLGD
jgi:hypothetical protein